MPLREHVKDSAGAYIIWDIAEPADFFLDAITLNAYETGRLQAIKFPLRALQFLCARYVLRLLLPHIPQTQFNMADDVPIVLGSPEYISISHSANMVAVMACHNQRCGIDIEHRDEKILRIKDKFSVPVERQLFNPTLPDIDVCTAIWTTKEAVYKCLHTKGLGFIEDMVIQQVNNQHIEVLYKRTNQVLQVQYSMDADYVLAWCLNR